MTVALDATVARLMGLVVDMAETWDHDSQMAKAVPLESALREALAQPTEVDHLRQCLVEAEEERDFLRRQVAKAEQDRVRPDSGLLMYDRRDEFGEMHSVIFKGFDLRAAIDAAIAAERGAG